MRVNGEDMFFGSVVSELIYQISNYYVLCFYYAHRVDGTIDYAKQHKTVQTAQTSCTDCYTFSDKRAN